MRACLAGCTVREPRDQSLHPGGPPRGETEGEVEGGQDAGDEARHVELRGAGRSPIAQPTRAALRDGHGGGRSRQAARSPPTPYRGAAAGESGQAEPQRVNRT